MGINRSRLLDPYTTDIEYVVSAHGPTINARACDAIAACNKGRFPETFRQWRSVYLFLGLRPVLVSPEILGEASVRYDNEQMLRGQLYVPDISNRRRMFFVLLHEASETAMKRPDLVPELHYPPEWGDHHTMACIVEWCHEREIKLAGCVWELE